MSEVGKAMACVGWQENETGEEKNKWGGVLGFPFCIGSWFVNSHVGL